jgi:uncharacterized protein with PIN domain
LALPSPNSRLLKLPIPGSDTTGNPPKRFYIDGTVLRLGKWLRFLGIDCPLRPLSETNFPEGLLLTKRKSLPHHIHQVAWVPYNDIKAQLAWFVEKFRLALIPGVRGTRCIRCNHLLQPVPKESVKNIVPDYIYQIHQHFRRCPQCEQIYWNGTHLQHMTTFLKNTGIDWNNL